MRLRIRRPPVTRHHVAAATALALAIAGTAAGSGTFTAQTCRMADDSQDPTCTPGVVNSEVRQSNIDETICVAGFTATIRPSTSYTSPLKREIMRWYRLRRAPALFEFDHLISLELGGDPRDPKNLWPQPYLPKPGAREKDRVEGYLHDQVCEGAMTLARAQELIKGDWKAIYRQIAK